jgi:serine/threonine-protein kinase
VVGGRYELVRLIAAGGMAEVWEARDQVLGRDVAVKLLHRHLADDATFTQRFRAEAVAAARLHHPSIVAIYDTCNDGGHEAIVMELVRGRTLREYLDEHGQLRPDEVVQIGADVADALSAAHGARIVHRDIKPANILLCDDARVMVTDFGIAKIRDDTDLTSAGTMLGTVKYLAPEQVESQPVDARTDIYALGVVLYEALVGRPPFVGDTAAATALVRLHQVPPAPSRFRHDVPHNVDAAVMRSLERDPNRRFADAAELRSALLAPSRPQLGPSIGADPTTVGLSQLDPTDWGPPPPRPAAPAPLAPLPATNTEPVRPRRWGWVLPAILVVLIGGSIGLAVALVARTQATGPTASGPTDAPVTIARVAAFDPLGDGQEHDSEAASAHDGRPATSWRSETYEQRDFGGAKPGVGLALTLDQAAALDGLAVSSPTVGWSGEVYVADGPVDSLEGWGAPISSASDVDGDVTFDLDGARGGAVLLWITTLGEQPHRMQVDELSIT